jgi:hypothetical protein
VEDRQGRQRGETASSNTCTQPATTVVAGEKSHKTFQGTLGTMSQTRHLGHEGAHPHPSAGRGGPGGMNPYTLGCVVEVPTVVSKQR